MQLHAACFGKGQGGIERCMFFSTDETDGFKAEVSACGGGGIDVV